MTKFILLVFVYRFAVFKAVIQNYLENFTPKPQLISDEMTLKY